MAVRIKYIYDCDCCKKKNVGKLTDFEFHVGWCCAQYETVKDTRDFGVCEICAKKISKLDYKKLDFQQTEQLAQSIARGKIPHKV
jgi:hypothetical protein